MQIYAILNADDFGLSPGINRGIIEAHRDGIVTSASLMAIGDAFEEAVALAHEYPRLSLGSHMHIHLLPGVFPTVLALTRRYHIPAIRLPMEGVLNLGSPTTFRGWCR